MKKTLPAVIVKNSGFSLLELLVVISIMAILAIIGISLYTNAQRSARDGIRKTEISSLARSIESTKDPTDNTYTYNSANYSADYPQNTPKDPLKLASAPYYCIKTNDGSSDIANPAAADWTATTTCPIGWDTVVDYQGGYNSGGDLATTGVKRWKICARLEVKNSPTCINSNQ